VRAEARRPVPGDLLQRHLLCGATRQHDPDDDGRCRDCLGLVGRGDQPLPADAVWDPELGVFIVPIPGGAR